MPSNPSLLWWTGSLFCVCEPRFWKIPIICGLFYHRTCPSCVLFRSFGATVCTIRSFYHFRPDARATEESSGATDNGIAAVAKILKYSGASIDLTQVGTGKYRNHRKLVEEAARKPYAMVIPMTWVDALTELRALLDDTSHFVELLVELISMYSGL